MMFFSREGSIGIYPSGTKLIMNQSYTLYIYREATAVPASSKQVAAIKKKTSGSASSGGSVAVASQSPFSSGRYVTLLLCTINNSACIVVDNSFMQRADFGLTSLKFRIELLTTGNMPTDRRQQSGLMAFTLCNASLTMNGFADLQDLQKCIA